MANATFSDRYALSNTSQATTAAIPNVLGISGSGAIGLLRVPFTITPQTGALNDLWYLGPLLIGYTIAGFFIDTAQLDTNGVPTLSASLGDSASAARFIAATSFGRAQGFFLSGTSVQVAASLPKFYSAYSTARSETGSNRSIGVADDLILKVTAAAATFSAAAVQGYYDLVMAEYPHNAYSGTNY